MKIRVTKISKVLANLRPNIKIGDVFEVIAKSNTAEQPANNPCYLVYDKQGLAISLYHNEIEEIETKKIKETNGKTTTKNPDEPGH